MFEEKAGKLAGEVWKALDERGTLNNRQLKRAINVRSEKDLYLALGWLLREGKISVEETDKSIEVSLAE